MELNWKDIAAIWGAALSTLLAALSLLPARPIFHIEPDDPHDAKVRIVNPSKRAVLVRDWFRFRLCPSGNQLGLWHGKIVRLTDVQRTGALLVLVPPEKEESVGVNLIGDSAVFVVGFLWRADWLVPLWLPSFKVLSKARIQRLKAGTASAS